jgi:hypothetical protein
VPIGPIRLTVDSGLSLRSITDLVVRIELGKTIYGNLSSLKKEIEFCDATRLPSILKLDLSDNMFNCV